MLRLLATIPWLGDDTNGAKSMDIVTITRIYRPAITESNPFLFVDRKLHQRSALVCTLSLHYTPTDLCFGGPKRGITNQRNTDAASSFRRLP